MALRRINLWKNPLLLPRPFSSSSSPIPTAPPASSIDDIRRQIESLAARGAPPGSSAASRSPPEPGEGEGRNPETSLFQEMHDQIPIAPSFHHHQLDQEVGNFPYVLDNGAGECWAGPPRSARARHASECSPNPPLVALRFASAPPQNPMQRRTK
uniref:Uncharacterized protein n=1 Tax=Oryza nivara TaxID=4536 RepID=A0A0E0GE76_ORYNI